MYPLAVFFLSFLEGCRGGGLGVNTIFPSMSDDFYWFSYNCKFPLKYA